MESIGMNFCCKAFEIGDFDVNWGDDRPLKTQIKDCISDYGDTSNARVIFATTTSEQGEASKALKELGFISTTPRRLNKNFAFEKTRTLRGWMLSIPAGKEY